MDSSINFARPPVIETVLGAQFDPLPDFSTAWLGRFWAGLPNDWKKASDTVWLDQQFERFGDEEIWGKIDQIRLRFEQVPPLRIQIKNAAGDRMMQLQNGRFFYNWLGEGGGDYARYAKIKPEFDEMFGRFRTFLEASFGEVRLNQWEVTYVNNLPKGKLWQSPADWPKILTLVTGTDTLPNGLALRAQSGAWHFEISERRGRLHIELTHGKEMRPDGNELLVLKLTARGPITSVRGTSLDEGLNLGRHAIVNSFASITTPFAHEIWELTK